MISRPSHPLVDGKAAAVPLAIAADGAIRILAGDMQSQTYVDRFGDQWLPDRYYAGGTSKNGPTNYFFPPADPGLFHTMRRGNFSYDIPLDPHRTYELRLYFVETTVRFGKEVGGDGENTRLFRVRANGHTLLDNFDVTEDVGLGSTTVRAFRNISAAADGKLHLEFTSQRDEPLVTAVELLPLSSGSIPPIRIHTAPFHAIDHTGKRWSPDNFYIGGQLYDPGVSFADQLDMEGFKMERVGNFSYAIPRSARSLQPDALLRGDLVP